ncbi:MAG: right-handed parallel beta-helix repeat-containing protein [Oscillospiraceae bacterium]|nr:right-handed parallel beta-helix repeat-containing protein [Oscillospiraceae bacterium]
MKRKVSLLLAMVMLLSMLPFAVWAQEDPIAVASVVDAEVTAEGYTVSYTAETSGTLHVTAGTCKPGWRYKVYAPGYESINMTKWSLSHDHKVSAGEVQVVFFAYSSAEADNVAGTVSFDVTFTPDGGAAEIEKVEYEISETMLTLGDNSVSMLETAYSTIFEFEPEEMGVYTFTAPADAKLGYWGAGSWFLMDPNSETNTCEWTCTGVGQSAFIGVSGVEGDFNLNVAKTGDYTPIQIIEQKYENKATLTAFEIPEGAKLGSYVDVMDQAVTHTAVLGDDGYYHLDSAAGDVLIVDFNYQDIILSAALQSDRPVMNAYVTDENGDTIKYDIGDAVLAYEEVMDGNGYYPVTEDIILFYQVYAVGSGTYTYHLTGMDYNEDCVWMYCMRTMNMDNVVEPEPEQPTEPSEPETQPTVPSEPEVTEPDVTEPEATEPEVEPSKPTPTEPAEGEVILNENVTASSGSKFVQSYTPAEDGTLYVTVGDGSAKWKSDLRSVVGLTFTTVATAEGTTQQTYSAEVTGGVKYQVRVWEAAEKALAETPLMIVFVPAAGAEPEPSEPETEPTVPSEPSEPETEPTVPSEPEPTTPAGPSADGALVVTNEEVTAAGYTYTYHAATAGTLNVTVGDCAPGWRYKVYSPDGVESLYRTKYSAGTSCDYTNVAGNWKVVFYAYSSAEADNVAGTVSFTITFTPDGTEPEVPTEPSEPETEPTIPSEPETEPTVPSEPETEPTIPETEPTEPETEPTTPSEPAPGAPELPELPVIPEAPAGAYYSITVDGNTTFSTSSAAGAMNNALKKISSEGYLKFYKDMNLGTNGTVDIYQGNVIVDLNGCTITGNFTGAGALYVDGGNVTLLDSSAEGDGVIQNSNNNGMGIEIYNGSVTMINGTVISGASSQGVKIWNSSSFTMYGGYVSGYNYGVNVMNTASATIYGGIVENTKPGTSFVYPLYAASTTTISISGGYFKGGAVSGTGLNGKISGGYFSTGFSENYLATDCTMESNSDPVYLWVVVDPNAVTPEEPEVTPVVAVYANGVEVAQYNTIAEAMAACAAGQYLVLIDNVTEDVTVTGDLYLDLNGKTLTGAVLGDGTLYAMDSATNDYNDDDMGGIVGNVMCNVPAQIETDITGEILKYLAVSDRNGMTFHRFYVGITAVSLNTATTGFGYKAEFYGDATVQAMVESVGYDLWVYDTVVTRESAFKNVLTLRLNNFLVEEFGETPVNAQVFMTLNNGVKLVSSVQSYTMRQVLEAVNADWTTYSEEQKSAVQTMCNKFYDVVSLWDLDNIFFIINIPIN